MWMVEAIKWARVKQRKRERETEKQRGRLRVRENNENYRGRVEQEVNLQKQRKIKMIKQTPQKTKKKRKARERQRGMRWKNNLFYTRMTCVSVRVCVCICMLNLQKLLFNTHTHTYIWWAQFQCIGSSIINTVLYHFDGDVFSLLSWKQKKVDQSHTNIWDKINKRQKKKVEEEQWLSPTEKKTLRWIWMKITDM